jgi:hypothetical protein
MAQQPPNTSIADGRRGMEREDALEYLQSFDLDPALLGEVISAGRQHTIFRYGADQVAKLPNRSLYMKIYGAFTYEIVHRDVELLRRYVPRYLPPTTVLHGNQDADDYVVLQHYYPHARFVNGAEFARVRDQFAEIARGNHQIIDQHDLSIDFFGNQSFRTSLIAAITGRKEDALLNNVVMIDDEHGQAHLLITDVNLSELKLGFRADDSFPRWLIDNAVFALTRWMIWRLFNVEVK